MLTWLLPTRNEQSFKFFYYFEDNSAAPEKNWKLLPSDVPREVTRVLAWVPWEGNGPTIPSLRALHQWSQPAFGNKVVASNSLAAILPPFSQTQTETHKAESDLMNLPVHALFHR